MYPNGCVRLLLPTTAIPRGGWERTGFWGLWPYQKWPTDAFITWQVILGGDETDPAEGTESLLWCWFPPALLQVITLISAFQSQWSGQLHHVLPATVFCLITSPHKLSQLDMSWKPLRLWAKTQKQTKRTTPQKIKKKKVSPLSWFFQVLCQWWKTDTPPIAIWFTSEWKKSS